MKTLGVREVRQRYDVLKETLEKEGEVILTHHGKPFARVLPLATESQQQMRASRGAARARLRASMPQQTVPSEVLVREDRDARG
jgi:antitoxin (DNA-binding transcriptional repressor) of toxin-antitoxin stability system